MFSRRMSAAVTVLLVLLVTFALVASALPVFAAPASAAVPAGRAALLPLHARLASTSPSDGATVPTARQVTLTFSEDVDPRFLVVRVTGPSGDETEGRPVVRGRTITQPLAPGLPAATHTVAYRVVSVDGHPVAGTLSFTTTTAPARPTASPDPTPAGSPAASPFTPSVTPTPTPLPSPASAPTDADAGTPLWLWGAGAVVLLLLGGAAAAWRTLSRPPSGAGDSAAGDEPGEDADGPFRG